MPQRLIEPLCAAILLAGCLVGGSAAAGRTLPAIPELLALSLLVVIVVARSGPAAPDPAPLWIVAAILALPAIQLVPLPPSVWSALPGRAPVAEAYATAGMALPWLPISLTPGATERIWLGLLPAAALFLAVPHLAVDARTRLMHLAIVIGVLDVLLGLAQVAGGPDSALRLYATASRTDAVGLFANRNHHATFLTLLVLFVGGLLADRSRGSVAERAWLSAAGVLLLLGIAASGSRAGLALGSAAGLAVAWILLADRRRASRWRSRIAWGGLAAMLLAIGLALGGPSVLRLQADAVTGDLRWQIARTTWRAVAEVFPVGGGFGSFERLYARIESPEDRASAVVNNAHDDWLELVLEGGLPALLMLVAALVYLGRATLAAGPRSGTAPARSIRSATLVALWLCALHEIVDYSLRTMAVNVVLALACGLRTVPAPAAEASSGRDRAVTAGRSTGVAARKAPALPRRRAYRTA